MKWLITGGCGFIGRNLIRHLAADPGHEIRVIDNLRVGTRNDLSNVCHFEEVSADAIQRNDRLRYDTPITLIAADILDEAVAGHVCRGIDTIVHLAANTGVGPSVENPRADCMSNVIGTLNYLEASRQNRVNKFIFASSGAPIGECSPPIHEELAPHPVSPYGASKLSGEAYCSAYYRTFGIETVALRFGNVYGPGSGHKDSVVARFIKRLLAGQPLEIYGDGNQTRDFIYIEDLINAILCTVESNISGEVFQIATQMETSVNELVTELKGVFANRLPDRAIDIRHRAPRKGDVQRNYSDTTKAKEELGWSACWSLKGGLEATLDWFLQHTSG